MKLATRKNGTRDGELIVVSRDNTRGVSASDIAPTLQAALDAWVTTAPKLQLRFEALQTGNVEGEFEVDTSALESPLPRSYAWIDGSAYINHIVLVRKARGAQPPETLETDPLVYQGGSDTFLGPCDDIPWGDPSWGLDFESEVAIITDDVPMGTKAADAAQHIKLLMLVNDVSLRGLIPPELKKGFGFYVSKPSTAFGPFAVTPDELGESFNEGRINLDMLTDYNGSWYGNPNAGPEMHFSFLDLIQHCSQTRSLGAGTIIGSGTVSNVDRARGSSCLAEKRMIEKIDTGEFITPFMVPGDTIKIRMLHGDSNIFGTIEQTVVAVD